jgi:HEAT repeat protein/Na+/melibiose symporter-like transporter
VLRTLRIANVDVAFATAFATLVTGSFQAGFVQHLGGSDAWINLLVALPSLLGILQIPGAIWGRSFSGYKGYILPGGLIWRLGYVPLVALPLLALPGEARLTLMALCIAIASAAVLLVNPIYNDWLAELVPSSSRGWYFGRRQVIGAIAGAAAGFIGGVVLDALKRAGQTDEGFAAVFGLGIVCAAVSFAAFARMRDIPRHNPIREPVLASIRGLARPFRDTNFRKVLVFLGAFTLGQMFAGNLFSAFALESIKMSFTLLQLAAAAHALGTVVFTPVWGYLADKYGNRPLLFLFLIGITITPPMWLFCYPGAVASNAAMWGGALLCQLNLMLATADERDRASYLGLAMALQAVVGGLAPLAGGELMTYLRGVVSADAAYKWVFIASMGFRVVATFALLHVREPGSVRIREALRHLRKVTPKGFAALRSLRDSESAVSREEAIRSAGREQMTLAAGEIIAALHDPSPGVRRQAALALGRLGDPRAAEALLHQLEEHPDLVEEETLIALGGLGDLRAAQPLVRFLRSPRAILRRAAARALGRLGSPEAIQPLLESARDSGDVELRRASLQALRLLRAREAEAVAGQALLEADPTLRIAAAELVSELELDSVANEVRDSMSRFDDEAESEVAYALGAVGDREDIPAILDYARKCVSMITRRRCLLGVARILGVESVAYRLLMTEGFARDMAIEDLTRAHSRKDPDLRRAIEVFSSGNERGALETLAETKLDAALEAMAKAPVAELFLVALAWLTSKGARLDEEPE